MRTPLRRDYRPLCLCLGLSSLLNLACFVLIGHFWQPLRSLPTPSTPHVLLLTLLPPVKPQAKLHPIVPPRVRHPATPLPPAPHRPSKVTPVTAHAGGASPRQATSLHLVALKKPLPDLPQAPKAVKTNTVATTSTQRGTATKPTPPAQVMGTGSGTGQGNGTGTEIGAGSHSGPFGIQGIGGGGEGPRHVVYVLDISGSMNMTEGKFGGESRIQRARQELDTQLKSLGPGETFSLIAFSDDVRRFRPRLVTADAQTVQDAERFLDGLNPDGDTDLEDALDAAFAMAGVNVIYVITDGVPRTPDHEYSSQVDFDALADRLDDANRQGARIYTIGLLGPNPDGTDESVQASSLLERIAADSGGTFKPISLDDAPQDSGAP